MVSILPMVDLLGNTAVDWFCILSYFRLDTLYYAMSVSCCITLWGSPYNTKLKLHVRCEGVVPSFIVGSFMTFELLLSRAL